MTTKVEESIQVDVPVSTAYNQWTQFEEFPHFMGGVREVRQLGDQRLHWVAEIAGVRREWDAAVLEQVPDQKVAWAATGGATNAGAVRFTPAGPAATVVHLTLEYEPEGVVEKAGDALGIVGRQAKSDLARFKEFIEDAGYESGAWRGTVQHGVSAGTPGVEDAAMSRGDSGKAGVSATTVVAGAAAVAAAAGAAVAASRSGSEGEPPKATATVPPPQPAASQPVTVVDQPPPDSVRDGVLIEEHDAEGYTAPSSTEGVEQTVRRDGDDPMVGGGSR
ncbi:Cyclase/dehydrase [Modestobacter italicus]|uniref:Cyclase/dehydrase n=1 Tax=Modestobacter italicus (strain DSM 44449 / CECT 9708 / BC 501) TaxID=2732864 RepID=I4EU48_MODI5|nr:SRPBCC family protein [Modestobacter marinus]CCH86911.1 Cyclase/dehydrase [Modestobacter marinus]